MDGLLLPAIFLDDGADAIADQQADGHNIDGITDQQADGPNTDAITD